MEVADADGKEPIRHLSYSVFDVLFLKMTDCQLGNSRTCLLMFLATQTDDGVGYLKGAKWSSSNGTET